MRRFTDEQLVEIALQDLAILNTARGFCGLKMYKDAKDELTRASHFSKTLADYLEIWSLIHAQHDEWHESLRCAEAMIIEEPDNEFGYQFRADSIRHLKDPQAAYKNLAEVVERFPASPLVRFNLACFACLSGRHFLARKKLIQTFLLAEKTEEVDFFHNLALNDLDLKPLRSEVSRIIEFSSKLNQQRERKTL